MTSSSHVRSKFAKWNRILAAEKSRLLKLFPISSKNDAVEEFSMLLKSKSSHPLVMECLAEYPSTAKVLLEELAESEGGPRLLISLRESYLNPSPVSAKQDQHLNSLLSSIFNNRKYLTLEQITYPQASRQLLEFLARSDKVRPPRNFSEFGKRFSLEGKLRCFAYFHAKLTADEPLCFVHVALSDVFIDHVSDLYQEDHPFQEIVPTTATFYSINSPFIGLYGLANFGRLLLKDVSNLLKSQYPSLRSFCTLSPIPGFLNWMQTTKPISTDLLELCTDYLNPDTTPDPVARFHYRNGAKLRAVLPKADNG